jgi:hypothetical protein
VHLEKLLFAQLVRKLAHYVTLNYVAVFTKSRRWRHPESDETKPSPHSFPKGLFLSHFPTKTLYAFRPIVSAMQCRIKVLLRSGYTHNRSPPPTNKDITYKL